MRKPGSIIHLKRILRKTIYRLKWLFGFPVDLYRDIQGVYNPETGIKIVTKSKIHIDRMIVFPGTSHRDIFFSISVIRANSNFVTGGDIQVDDRQFIIDGKDLPIDYVVTLDDYVIWNHERWDIKSIYNLEGGTGYYLVGRKISNQIVHEIFDYHLWDKLEVTSTFSVG